jgi:hypothetical protein
MSMTNQCRLLKESELLFLLKNARGLTLPSPKERVLKKTEVKVLSLWRGLFILLFVFLRAFMRAPPFR